MKKLLSIVLVLLLMFSCVPLALITSANDTNLAATYTYKDGQITWSSNAGAFLDDADSNTSINGGYSWKFGMPESNFYNNPAYVYIKAAGLEPNTTYSFSHIYQGDYIICFDGVTTPGGNPITTLAEAVDTALNQGDRAHQVATSFTTTVAGDYTITLKMGKENNNTDCKWDASILCDLVLEKQLQANLAANYTYKGGQITWSSNAGGYLDDADSNASINGGYSWKFGMPSSHFYNNPAYVYIKAAGLESNTTYSFSHIYQGDYIICFDSATAPDGTVISPNTEPTDVALNAGDRAHQVSASFTTTDAGDYTISLKMGKENNNTDCKWDSSILCDLVLEKQLQTNLAANYTYKGGQITWSSNAGPYLDDADQRATLFGGYGWKFGINKTNFTTDPAYVYIKASDLKANMVYAFSYIYQQDYVIAFDSVDNSARIISAAVDTALGEGDRAHQVTTFFQTKEAGEYTIALKMGKENNNTDCKWDAVRLGDLTLYEQPDMVVDPNLAANYTYKGGQITWSSNAGPYLDDADSNASVNGGYSWKFGINKTNFATDPAYVYIKASGLAANTKYEFSYIYQQDYVIVFDSISPSATIAKEPVDTALTTGDRAHQVKLWFVTDAAGEYTITLKMGKENNNVDCKWDAVVLSDLVLEDISDRVYGTIEGTSGGTVSGWDTDFCARGETVTLTATPLTGNTFLGWFDAAGALISDQTAYTFTADADFHYTAKFDGHNKPFKNWLEEHAMDGTFETGTMIGWYAMDYSNGDSSDWCQFKRSSYTAYNGSYSLCLESRYRTAIFPFDGLTKSTDYHLSFYVTLPDTYEYASLRYCSITNGDTVLYQDSPSLTAMQGGSGWHKVDIYFNSDDFTEVDFNLYYINSGGSQAHQFVYLDDVSLVEYQAAELANADFQNSSAAWCGNYTVADGAASIQPDNTMYQTVTLETQSLYTLSFRAKGTGFAGVSNLDRYTPTTADLLSSESGVALSGDTWQDYTITFYSNIHPAANIFFTATGDTLLVDDLVLTKQPERIGGVIENIDFETDRFALRHSGEVFELYQGDIGDPNVHSGTKSLHFKQSAATADTEYLLDEAFLSLQLGKNLNYNLTMYYKLENGGSIKLAPEYRGLFSETGGTTHTAPDDGWQKLSFVFTNSEYSYIKLIIGNILNKTTGDFYIDDITLTVLAPLVQETNSTLIWCESPLNVLNNESFEQAVTQDDWINLPDTATIRKDGAATGASYLRISNGTFYVLPLQLEAGQAYYLAASLRGSPETDGFLAITADPAGTTLYNDLSGVPASFLTPKAGSADWSRAAFRFTADETGIAYLVFSCGEGYLDIDSVQLYKAQYGLETDPNDYTEKVPFDYDALDSDAFVYNGGAPTLLDQSATPDSGETTKTDSPKTGDSLVPPFLIGSMALFLAGVLLLTRRSSKQQVKGGTAK